MGPKLSPVAVVGLGNLGLAMATRLDGEGWDVRGMDTSTARVDAAASLGIGSVASGDLAACRVILFVVPDEVAVRAVLTEERLLESLTPEHLVICHSTVLPTRAQELAAEAERTGARFLEVPVSGGAQRAERGELTLFVAGETGVIREARTLLETLGSHVVEVGAVGAGAAAKLANQLVMFAAQAALLEAMRLAAAYGVSERVLLEGLGSATGDTWVGRNWGFFDEVAADYDQSEVPLASRPWVKDTAEILDAAADRGIDLPLADLVRSIVGDGIEQHSALTRERATR